MYSPVLREQDIVWAPEPV